MAEPLATTNDLTAHGVDAGDSEDGLLRAASAIVRAEFPGIDERIADEHDPLDVDLVAFVVVSMIARRLRSPADEKTQLSRTAGPYTDSATFQTSGGLYLTKRERRWLRLGGVIRGAFSVALDA